MNQENHLDQRETLSKGLLWGAYKSENEQVDKMNWNESLGLVYPEAT